MTQWFGLVISAVLVGCATTGYPGAASFSDEESASLGACQYEHTTDGHVFRCEAGRFLDGRVDAAFSDVAAARDRFGAAHPTLARPKFMKSDASTLNGEAVIFSMLGFDDALAILITEAEPARGRAVMCAFPGDPQQIVADVARWCKVRVGAIWRTL